MLRRLATPPRILLLGWLLFVVYAYPGYMTFDSEVQLEQARHIAPLDDWHPPMMAFLWRITDNIIAGPFPMLAIQSVAFLLGTYALLRRRVADRSAAIAAALILLAPPVLAPMAVIWKDSQMAGFLVAGAACLLAERRAVRVVGLALLGLATAMRYNAAAATLPIVVGLFVWSSADSKLRRIAIATAAWIALTAVALVADEVIVETHAHPWSSSVALRDLAGTIRYAPHLSDDDILGFSADVPWAHRDKIQIRTRIAFHPEAGWLDLIDEPNQIFTRVTDPQRDAVASAWWHVVTSYPHAYLHLRAVTLVAMLGVRPGAVWDGFVDAPWAESTLQHRATHAATQRAWLDLALALGDSWLFMPGVYFALAIALLVIGRRDPIARVVLASGLIYEIATSLVAPSVDYRYSHWMIACTLAGGTLVVAARLRARLAT